MVRLEPAVMLADMQVQGFLVDLVGNLDTHALVMADALVDHNSDKVLLVAVDDSLASSAGIQKLLA
jgi:hypothetical protein